MADTKTVMLDAIRDHIRHSTGQETYGAVVVMADTTPLDDLEDSSVGNFYLFKQGGFFACEGLLSLAEHNTRRT